MADSVYQRRCQWPARVGSGSDCWCLYWHYSSECFLIVAGGGGAAAAHADTDANGAGISSQRFHDGGLGSLVVAGADM